MSAIVLHPDGSYAAIPLKAGERYYHALEITHRFGMGRVGVLTLPAGFTLYYNEDGEELFLPANVPAMRLAAQSNFVVSLFGSVLIIPSEQTEWGHDITSVLGVSSPKQ